MHASNGGFKMNTPTTKMQIRLSKEVEGTYIEVLIENESSIFEGYELLNRLVKILEVAQLKSKLTQFWTFDDGDRRISSEISEGPLKVALSILDSWPEGKLVKDIETDTGLSQGHVSNILAGRKGDAGKWFSKDGDKWLLTSLGIDSVVKELLDSNETHEG